MTIGSNTKFGRIIAIRRDGVIVEDGQGRRKRISFKKLKDRYRFTKQLAI